MKPRSTFAVCVNNNGYPASLEVAKLYRVIPDDAAEKHGYLRVVDESGEDYAYSSDRFFPLKIPTGLKKVLHAVPANRTLQPASRAKQAKRQRSTGRTPRG